MAHTKSGSKLPPLGRGHVLGQKQGGGNDEGSLMSSEAAAAAPGGAKGGQAVEGIVFYSSYVSEAIKHMQLRQLDIALVRLESASKLRPKDATSRLLKARCLISQSKMKMALNIINQVLRDNPEDCNAAEMKGEVLYHIGSFEQAIVQYQKAKTMRPKKRTLREGIENCEQAMRNAIGSRARQTGGPNTQEGTEFEMEEPENSRDREFFDNKEAGVVRDITEREPQYVEGGLRHPRKKNNRNVLLGICSHFDPFEKLLEQEVTFAGDFQRDYVFLQELMDRQIVTNKRTSLGREVAPVVEEALKYLEARADFWQRQEPMYRRDQSGAYKVADKKAMKGEISCDNETKMQYRNAIQDMNKMLEEGDFEGDYRLGKEAINMVQKYFISASSNTFEAIANFVHHLYRAPEDELNAVEKIILAGELLNLLGVAQQKMGNSQKAQEYFTKDKDLAYEHNNEQGKYRSLDSLTSSHIVNKQFGDALTTLLERLKLTEEKYKNNPQDKTLEADLAWLHHELARTYLQLNNAPEALKHAQKSVEFAELSADGAWIIQVKKRCTFFLSEPFLGITSLIRATLCWAK